MDDEKDNGLDPNWTIAGTAAETGLDPEEGWDKIPMQVWPLANYWTLNRKYKPIDWSEHEVTDRYDFVDIPADDPWPRFKVRHLPRRPGDTDAQHAFYRRWAEEYYRCWGVYLGLAQEDPLPRTDGAALLRYGGTGREGPRPDLRNAGRGDEPDGRRERRSGGLNQRLAWPFADHIGNPEGFHGFYAARDMNDPRNERKKDA